MDGASPPWREARPVPRPGAMTDDHGVATIKTVVNATARSTL
jgi:hypothetical protein